MPSQSRLLTLASALWLASMATAAPAVVVLVRHAEKQAAPADDPSLTPAGKHRAEELARVVAAWTAAGGRVRGLFASNFKRTQQTLAPLASAAHLTVTMVKADQTDALVRKILAINGGIVVVAGHSDTLPDIIRALGGPAGLTIGDSQFDRLFVLTAPGASPASLVALRYGD